MEVEDLNKTTLHDNKIQENLQARILNELSDVIYVSTPDTYELVYVNDAFKKNWGEDVIGKKCYKVMQNRNDPCPFCTNHIIFDPNNSGAHVWEFQNEVTKKWFQCTDKAIQWDENKKVRLELAADISNLKEAEFRLKESEEKYKMLFHSMIEGYGYHEVVYDSNKKPIDFIFRDVNKRFEDFTGLRRVNIINKKASECIPNIETDQPGLIEKYGLIGRDGGEISFELYFKTTNTWFYVTVFRPKPDFFCTILENITAKKAAELQLKQTLKELKESNQELEQFAYVASHDLQEPLRMVASFTNLIQKKFKDQIGEKGNMYIEYATDGASRMQFLINDLLDFSRISTRGGKFEISDCNTTVDKAIANLEYAIKENHAIITKDRLPKVMADENQLARVFQNLISNAIKFHSNTPPKIHISNTKEGSNYVFCVTDNGIGIDKKFKDKIFVIFQRLNARHEYNGTGIGLAICKRIINRHKGHIWVESEPGSGSRFYFTLPIKTPKR